jgi:hypothetical protein
MTTSARDRSLSQAEVGKILGADDNAWYGRSSGLPSRRA